MTSSAFVAAAYLAGGISFGPRDPDCDDDDFAESIFEDEGDDE